MTAADGEAVAKKPAGGGKGGGRGGALTRDPKGPTVRTGSMAWGSYKSQQRVQLQGEKFQAGSLNGPLGTDEVGPVADRARGA